jgi:hypothetical protein
MNRVATSIRRKNLQRDFLHDLRGFAEEREQAQAGDGNELRVE